MTARAARRGLWRAPRLAAAILVLATVGAPALSGTGLAHAASADPAPAYVATATPTVGLTDGKAVTINVKSTPGNVVYQGRAAVCRAGVTYQTSTDSLYAPDAFPNGPNCSLAPISSSADSAVVDSNMITGAASPEGETMTLRVGVGVVSWTDNTDQAQTLSCGPSSPCDLVVELYGGPQDGSSPPTWVPFVRQLTYADSDPLTTCGGAAAGALSTGGSDALVDAWTLWTLDQCKEPGQTGAATRASFVGEGQALQEYDSGLLDLAYTSAGSDSNVALDPTGTPRPSVAVPVGIGAVTLAVGNGYGSGGRKVPFPTLDLTADEAASVVGSGSYMTADQEAPIVARNPELSPFFFAPSTDMQSGVPSGVSASSWYLSKYFTTVAPDGWKVPDIGAAGSDAGHPRGVFNDFGTAQPDFTLLTTYSGRPALDTVLFRIVQNTFLDGAVFVVSDLTTAKAESLAPVAIQSGAATAPFVAPTQASMDAAVADMTPDAQGLLQPNPQPTDPSAYPLTYVEYALVPAQPLVDATCTPRAATQAQLTTWLNYVIGDGQAVLPDGLEPLTPALHTAAVSAIAQVGATPNTCTPPPAASSTGSGGSADGGATGVADSGAGSFGSTDNLAAGPDGNSVSSTGGAGSLKGSKVIAARVSIPPYGGSGVANAAITVAALLAVVALITLAARYTAGAGGPPGSYGHTDPDGDADADPDYAEPP